MSILTLDALLAGMRPQEYFAKALTGTLAANQPRSLWYLGGNPSAGSAVANTAGGVNLSSTSALVAGQIRHVDPGSGNAYLARLMASGTIAGQLLLCDRLQQICGNSGGSQISVTSTSLQTLNSGTLPARDNNGATSGDGVLCGVEFAAGGGAGTPTITLSYTNQAGSSGKASTNIDLATGSPVQGVFYRMSLAGNDTGVQSVQSLTLSATQTSGQISLVLYRILAALELTTALAPYALDALTGGFQQIYNGTVPFLIFVPSATTSTSIAGQYIESQG